MIIARPANNSFKRWHPFAVAGVLLLIGCMALYLLIDSSLIFSKFVVQGMVVDQNGQPVPGVRLTFHASEYGPFFSNKHYEQDVVKYSSSSGRFKVGSPYRLLQLRGIDREGYVGILGDTSLQGGFARPTAGIKVQVYSETGPGQVVDRSQPQVFHVGPDGIILLDLINGDLAANPSMADISITSRRIALPDQKTPFEIEIRAVNGGVRLSAIDAPYAPKGDYIEGVRASWLNYPAINYAPIYVSGFLESQNLKHIGHFDIQLGVPDRSTGISEIRIQSRINVDGERFVSANQAKRPKEFDKLPAANWWVLTEQPWWSYPCGLQPIISKDQALNVLATTPVKGFADMTDDALAQSRCDEAVFIAIMDRNWSIRGNGVLRSLAENPSASDSVLERLATHPDEHVRIAVANRVSCPQHLLDLLSNDSSPSLRQGARRPFPSSRR